MSEETNETLGNENEEVFDITDLGASETTETSNEQESKRSYGSMNSAQFEKELTDFFNKYQKSKLRFVARIVNEFQGHEAEVLEHLHNKYVLKITPEKKKKSGKKKSSGAAANTITDGHGGHGETKTEAIESGEKPKKSKKWLIITIIAIIVLGGGGTAVWMFKDKLFGGGHGTEHGAEHGAADGHGATEGHGAAEVASHDAPVTDSTATATDSTATATPDSTVAAPAETHGEGH